MNIISNALFMITLSLLIMKEYGVIQTYHYEFSKYVYHLKKNRKHYCYFLYFLLGVFVFKLNLLYITLSMILLLYMLKQKIKLKYTFRIQRLLVINFILLTLLCVTDTLKYVFILPFLYLLLLHCLSLLIEKIVFIKFLKKAKKKIKGKYIIGVTGSCGKTSVKNIIYDLMINNFNVVKTPKSYNNRVGITKSINDYVDEYTDYFICEYGVDKVNGMERLVNIVKPNIAVITEIGNQHLLSFKNRENILNEKVKLINSLNEKGVGIVSNDNDLLRNYDYHNKNILRYGIKHQSDVMAKNIKLFSDKSEFDLYIKDKFITRISVNLLSYHSVENVLCAITVCLALDMSIEDILKNIKNIKPIEHRLEFKFIDDIEIIDDSYNSNVKGFKEALDVLNLSSKYKIIITPGIIEQGKNNEELSIELAKDIINKVDYVYLISENAKYIKKYFDSIGYKNYSCKCKFSEAFEKIKTIEKEKIVLIENDLPDIYLN